MADFSGTVFCFEAPLDAMMVPNGVALGGTNNNEGVYHLNLLCKRAGGRLVMVYDNDYAKNADVLKQLLARIEEGISVVIYDGSFSQWKDAGDAIMSGVSEHALTNYYNSRTFGGLKARLELSSTLPLHADVKTNADNKKKSFRQKTPTQPRSTVRKIA